jgi:hypothetical protein
VSLNFKVPFEFRLRFKMAALREQLTMTEFLLRLVSEHMEAESRHDESDTEGRRDAHRTDGIGAERMSRELWAASDE